MDAVFDDPQVRHLQVAVPVRHPVRGDIPVVGQPVDLSRTPAQMSTALPELGAHADEVLGELGLSAQQIAALRTERAI